MVLFALSILLTKVYITYLKADVPPVYLLIKHSHSSGSKYFSRCLYIMFTLVSMHSEASFHISYPFGSSNMRRRWNGAMCFGPCYLILTLVIWYCFSADLSFLICLLFQILKTLQWMLTYRFTRKYLFRKYILGVLTHKTA